MIALQRLVGTTVFLANLEDIQLGEAESMDVSIASDAADGVPFFDETICCEADGYCYLRDLLSLLRPHLSAGMNEIELTVNLDVFYFNVFYCLSYIEISIGDVEDWLDSHFLTTSEVKMTTKDSKERLAIYTTDNVHVSYQALYLLEDGTRSTVSGRFSDDRTIYERDGIICYDFSPSVVNAESGVDGQLLGYMIMVEDRSMRFLLDPTVDETQVAEFIYLNAFGIEENLTLVGTLEAPRQIEYTSVYLQGIRRTLSPQLQIPYKLSTALLTSYEVVSLTEMLASESVWYANSPDDIALVNYSGDLNFIPTSEPGKAARAEFSFSYASRSRRWVDGLSIRSIRTFDDTFDQSFN